MECLEKPLDLSISGKRKREDENYISELSDDNKKHKRKSSEPRRLLDTMRKTSQSLDGTPVSISVIRHTGPVPGAENAARNVFEGKMFELERPTDMCRTPGSMLIKLEPQSGREGELLDLSSPSSCSDDSDGIRDRKTATTIMRPSPKILPHIPAMYTMPHFFPPDPTAWLCYPHLWRYPPVAFGAMGPSIGMAPFSHLNPASLLGLPTKKQAMSDKNNNADVTSPRASHVVPAQEHSELRQGNLEETLNEADIYGHIYNRAESSNRYQRKNYKNMTRERRVEANARERTRVHTISAAFEDLRRAVPSFYHTQRLSKLAILRTACCYIMALGRLTNTDYSEGSTMSFQECVELCNRTIQQEGKVKRKRD